MRKPGLVASDVDGTLLDAMEQVSERTVRAIASVTASGTPFILVSGRPPRWIPHVAKAAGLDGFAVCANGAVLYDIAEDRIVSFHGLDPVRLHDVAHTLEQALPGIRLATERPVSDGPAFLTEATYLNPWGNGENSTGTRAEVLGEKAVKLLVRHTDMTSEEMAVAAKAVLDDSVTVTFSTSNGLLEISAQGVTKATGLAEAAEHHGLDASSVVAFGDMPNDIEMLRWAGHGVAMANAHADVLAVADEITATNVDDGVAQVLERWFWLDRVLDVRHVAVIGGGIVGLAVAHELMSRGDQVTVLEKEDQWAAHQTGNNSNVVHAGLYYKPGSFKARMSVAGNKSIIGFARDNGVPVEICGKLVVATSEDELPALYVLAARASENGVPAKLISTAEAREYEPEVSCVAALRVHSTGIIDFPGVCAALVMKLAAAGADLRLSTPALAIRARGGRVEIATGSSVIKADALVNCAGLQSDRVARLAGVTPKAQIVPFRGEYYELRPDRRHLVRGLIYPVPDAALPFLGVHLTRMLDGSVHAGPNAVLALRREGYRWRDVSIGDMVETARFTGSWKLARRYGRTGLDEVRRSLSRKRFAASLARLVPAVQPGDLVKCTAGVRAQALLPDGSLVDDFLIETAPNQVHVLNAPSPAATSALEIARYVADQVKS